MPEFDCDLHFHGLYAGGVSKNMLLPVIAEQAKIKGLDAVATADILHGKWFEHVKENLIEENGVFKDKEFNTAFFISTEVQCTNKVHHLIYFPDLASAETLKEKLKGKAIMDSMGCGRPVVHLPAEEIAGKALDCGAIIGPAHAFTPYFSVYAHFNSLEELYGRLASEVNFLELGLSADSSLADLIEGNHHLTFLTNSDSHSPWPHRLGREFNRMSMKKPCFEELKKVLARKGERKISLNVGLNPKEGKYHCTACNNCFEKFSLEQAKSLNWSCLKCRGQIKKGVKDRINELASFPQETHPSHRPPYRHILPLAEIIMAALDVKSVNSKAVQSTWMDFVSRFKSEINVLIDLPIEELAQENQSIAKKIQAFRQDLVLYQPGGGGDYGRPFICSSEEEFKSKQQALKKEIECGSSASNQKTLTEF